MSKRLLCLFTADTSAESISLQQKSTNFTVEICSLSFALRSKFKNFDFRLSLLRFVILDTFGENLDSKENSSVTYTVSNVSKIKKL